MIAAILVFSQGCGSVGGAEPEKDADRPRMARI
jgi:hypothetical protein